MAFTCVVEFASQMIKKSHTASLICLRSMLVTLSPFFSLIAEIITSTAGGNESFLAGCFFFTLLALISTPIFYKNKE